MKNTAAIFDFGTSKVICAVSQQQKDGMLQVKGAEKAQYNGFVRGQWQGGNIETAIEEALLGAQTYYGHKIKRAYVGIPAFAGEILVKDVELAFEEPLQITEDVVTDLIDSADSIDLPENKTILHRCVISYFVDDEETMDPVQNVGSKISASLSLVLVDIDIMNMLTQAVQNCGVQVERCLFTPLGQGLGLIPIRYRDAQSIMIDMGYHETTFCLFKGDGIIAYKRLDTGGAEIISKLAQEMELPLEHAEQLKKRYVFGLAADGKESYDIVKIKDSKAVSYSHNNVQRIIEEYTDWFIQAMEEFFNAAGWEMSSRSRIYFTGGGLTMNGGIREHLALRLDRQIRIIRPLGTYLTAQTETSALGSLNFIFAALQPVKKPMFRFRKKNTEV